MLQHLFEKVWYAQIKVYTVSLGTSVNLDTTVAVSTMVVCQYCNKGSEPKALYGSLVSCADVSYMYSCIQHFLWEWIVADYSLTESTTAHLKTAVMIKNCGR